MATLSIDLMPWLQRRAEDAAAKRKQEEQDAALRQAMALAAFGGAPGTQGLDPTAPVPGLAGVTDTTSPVAGLQQELANDQLEQQRQAALPALAAMQQSALLTRAGLDPAKMAQARLETLRGNLLADNAEALTPAARVNAANKQDVSPVRSEGGVFYNRFNEQVPFIGMSEPAAALADSRWAAMRASDAAARASGATAGLRNTQADIARLRLEALQGTLAAPGVAPLLAADAAHSKAAAKPQRVKVKDPAGDRYYDAIRRPDGGFDYTLVQDAAGKPLQVPTAESDARTALQKDTQFIADTLGLKPDEAILMKLQSRGKSDQALSDEIGLRLMSADPSAARLADRDPTAFQAKVAKLFQAIRPGVAVPAPTVPAASAPQAPATGAPTPAPAARASSAADPRYAEARDAIARGADPARVRERLRSLGLDPAGR